MKPTTETELSEAVAQANGPLKISAGGTRGIGRQIDGAPLNMTGLSGITLYEPGALTIVAQAGTPLAEIEAALASEKQRLAFEPMDCRKVLGTSGSPTIGGVIATNSSGPRRVVVGAARDHMLGVRFVDGTGRVLKNGGRVMKNVTGYDLVKLMTGSYGTLGVISEVSLKVLPTPETEGTLTIHGLSVERAVAAMSAALTSPFEVTGAAHLIQSDAGSPETLLRIEGFEASVAYRLARLKDALYAFGDVQTSGAQSPSDRWREIRDLAFWADCADDIWRLSVRPSDAPGIVARLPAGARVVLDWGGGLIWAAVPNATDLRAELGSFSGHATLIKARGEVRPSIPIFHPEPTAIAALNAGLRAQFDPRGILNPGLMN
ncbi:FAD-binding protein [Flavimaricola marinus]|uniref:Putative FAD-linked oxidoreductase n=1 Tax=Flavimaricola marinus TaxID=1819565 RepID=A0A238L913_9RHOB|nr:FAD-binding protein [Flavimaricola marinus]SMY06197.1 putative FAD-linked oxidoreductase [Flavimaricola marinus]